RGAGEAGRGVIPVLPLIPGCLARDPGLDVFGPAPCRNGPVVGGGRVESTLATGAPRGPVGVAGGGREGLVTGGMNSGPAGGVEGSEVEEPLTCQPRRPARSVPERETEAGSTGMRPWAAGLSCGISFSAGGGIGVWVHSARMSTTPCGDA